MPKIVNKLQKRQDIALSSTELFCTKGFYNLTVGEVAKNAQVAKGTIYEYFDSKEDIVFAIIEYAQVSYDNEVLKKIHKATTIQNKVLALFDLCISTTPEGIKRRRIYKEFINICLNEASSEMILFQKKIKDKYIKWLEDILQDGIDQKILQPEAINFAKGLFAMAEGILLFAHIDKYFQADILQEYITNLFDLIKIKGEKND